jgi:acetylglutamate/LysW-gamma-L-alpha-aminoadipate kinase
VTIVVKVGGAAGNALDPVLDELSRRSDYVLVHGGSEEVDRLGAALGRPAEYYTSPSGVVSRKSTPAHLEVVTLALSGVVQTRLVAGLAARGRVAVGLSGLDGGLIRAHQKQGARAQVDGRVVRVEDDRSGTIDTVDPTVLRLLLSAGIVPVVGPPAADGRGELLNVDADRVAAAVATALSAEALVLLTNVSGVRRDPDDPGTVIARVPRAEIEAVLAFAAGRMKKKVLAAREALAGGVGSVVIASSHGPDPIAHALAGAGTVFV